LTVRFRGTSPYSTPAMLEMLKPVAPANMSRDAHHSMLSTLTGNSMRYLQHSQDNGSDNNANCIRGCMHPPLSVRRQQQACLQKTDRSISCRLSSQETVYDPCNTAMTVFLARQPGNQQDNLQSFASMDALLLIDNTQAAAGLRAKDRSISCWSTFTANNLCDTCDTAETDFDDQSVQGCLHHDCTVHHLHYACSGRAACE